MILLGFVLLVSGALFALVTIVFMIRKDYKRYKKIETRYKNADVLEFN